MKGKLRSPTSSLYFLLIGNYKLEFYCHVTCSLSHVSLSSLFDYTYL